MAELLESLVGKERAMSLKKHLHEKCQADLELYNLDEEFLENIFYCRVTELCQAIREEPGCLDQADQRLTELSPQDLMPSRWIDIQNKIKIMKYKMENLATTDVYECERCHERKSTVTQVQTRSADEPATIFVSCTQCGHTMTID